jgi:hypothetical protein
MQRTEYSVAGDNPELAGIALHLLLLNDFEELSMQLSSCRTAGKLVVDQCEGTPEMHKGRGRLPIRTIRRVYNNLAQITHTLARPGTASQGRYAAQVQVLTQIKGLSGFEYFSP